jgi:hypothetical protein
MRSIVLSLLVDFLNHNSRVHHPAAGYVLSSWDLHRFNLLFKSLTKELDSVDLHYLQNMFVAGDLDTRYFKEKSLPVDRQSSHSVEECKSMRVISQWSDSYVRSIEGTVDPVSYRVL